MSKKFEHRVLICLAVILPFMANGAEYVGDEWVYLTGDGRRMYGIPEPIRVWNWHLEQLREYRRVVGYRDRTWLRILQLVASGIDRVTSDPPRGSVSRNLRRARWLIAGQLHVDVAPQRLFGSEACRLAGVPEKILFVTTHESPEVTVRPVAAREVAARMVASLQYEQMHLLSYYQQFKFAFPGSSSELIESSGRLQEILDRVLSGKEAYEVRHPYPVAISSLFDEIYKRCLRS